MQNGLELLKKHFGYSEFHPMQENIINDIMACRDALVLMPTGSGKSLCYQLPAVMKSGVTVVVSPLIALMKDQVDSLRSNGIGASFINSTLSAGEIEGVKTRLLENKDRILYIAPERLASQDFTPFLKTLKIGLFAIDEAHCISEWGHDFRPEYRQLKLLRENFPGIPIIALTATAVPDVQKDIIQQLKLAEPKIYKASFNRENLFYYVRPKEDAYEQIVNYIRGRPKDSGIIYCQSRRTAENLAEKLREDGFRALPYHAGMASDLRSENQERFIHDDVEVIAATIAFGMGIHKTNVRYVIHYDLPTNLESYYQETGRAGRDRLESDCILFFSYGDKVKIEALIEKKKNPERKRIAYKKLNAMIKFCESVQCRRKMLLAYFGEEYDGRCGKCDTCLQPRETFDGAEAAKKALGCVQDINQRFGTNYAVSILTGKENKRSKAYNHHSLKSYGIGKEYTAKQWQTFIRELIRDGCIDVVGDKYPVLKLNQKSRDILAGRLSVFLTKPAESHIVQIPTPDNVDIDLFDILRGLRKNIADTNQVPPYIIFPDKTLKEMATYYPRDLGSMKKIHGIGQIKLERYGKTFLEKIADYCKLHNIRFVRKIEKGKPKAYTLEQGRQQYPKGYEEWTEGDDLRLKNGYAQGKTISELADIFQRTAGAIRSRLKNLGLVQYISGLPYTESDDEKSSRTQDDTYTKTLELCKQGMTLEEIAKTRNLATSTIVSHIEKLLMAGEDINIDNFVGIEKQRIIQECMRNLRTPYLTPIKENLGNDYSYEEIRLVRAKSIFSSKN